MELKNTFAGDASPEAVAAAVAEDGYAVVRDAVDADTVAAVNADLAPYFEKAHDGHEEFYGNLTKRYGALLAKSTSVQALLVHPTVLAVADDALLPHCVRYRVHYTGVMHIEPGETRQVLHRDIGLYPIASPCPPLTVATMWALSDFSRKNGGTRLVPGSHLWSSDRDCGLGADIYRKYHPRRRCEPCGPSAQWCCLALQPGLVEARRESVYGRAAGVGSTVTRSDSGADRIFVGLEQSRRC